MLEDSLACLVSTGKTAELGIGELEAGDFSDDSVCFAITSSTIA